MDHATRTRRTDSAEPLRRPRAGLATGRIRLGLLGLLLLAALAEAFPVQADSGHDQCTVNLGACDQGDNCDNTQSWSCDDRCVVNDGDCTWGGDCTANLLGASCGSDGRCALNARYGTCVSSGHCLVNTGLCTQYGACTVNTGTCGVHHCYAGDGPDCSAESGCTVNLGTCQRGGRCSVNVGDCRNGGDCDVNMVSCDGGACTLARERCGPGPSGCSGIDPYECRDLRGVCYLLWYNGVFRVWCTAEFQAPVPAWVDLP